MKSGPDIARAAALIGDPARANMLTALLSGRALTATELAQEAGVTAQTASSHLAKLQEGGLLTTARQGRHRYFRLARPEVGAALEALMGLADQAGHHRTRTGPRDPALRQARVCYDHLAGEAGVRMFASLAGRGLLAVDAEDVQPTANGEIFFADFGVDLPALARRPRPLCRACLDWSERRSHLAGSLGAALLDGIGARGWAKRLPDSRVVRFSPPGQAAFDALFPAA